MNSTKSDDIEHKSKCESGAKKKGKLGNTPNQQRVSEKLSEEQSENSIYSQVLAEVQLAGVSRSTTVAFRKCIRKFGPIRINSEMLSQFHYSSRMWL